MTSHDLAGLVVLAEAAAIGFQFSGYLLSLRAARRGTGPSRPAFRVWTAAIVLWLTAVALNLARGEPSFGLAIVVVPALVLVSIVAEKRRKPRTGTVLVTAAPAPESLIDAIDRLTAAIGDSSTTPAAAVAELTRDHGQIPTAAAILLGVPAHHAEEHR